MAQLPDVHFGNASAKPLDWRDPKLEDKTPDDDAEVNPTPPDTVEMLGFDPAKVKE
jgi:hypothetical protein